LAQPGGESVAVVLVVDRGDEPFRGQLAQGVQREDDVRIAVRLAVVVVVVRDLERARLRRGLDGPVGDVARILSRIRLLARRVDARRGDERHRRRGQVLLKGGERNATSGDGEHDYDNSRSTSSTCSFSGASPMLCTSM